MRATINNWPLARKMLAAFAVIAMLLIGVASTGIVTNDHLNDIAGHHVTSSLAGVAAIGDVLSQVREQRIIVYSRYNALNEKEAAKLTARLEKNHKALVAGVAEFRRVAGAGLEPGVALLEKRVARLNAVSLSTFAACADGTPDAALALIKTDGKDASHDAIDQAELLEKQTLARAAASHIDGETYAATAQTLAIALSATALLCLFGIWYLISRTVALPMAALADTTTRLAAGETLPVPSRDRADELGRIACAVESFSAAAAQRAAVDAARAAEQSDVTQALGTSLKAISDGDLTRTVTADFAPAYVALKTDFNHALSGLSGLVGAVGEGVSAIRSGSREIAQASENLARRTEANAASLEQTSAALVQIDGRLRESATTSARTVARADQAIASVGGGRATAEVAVAAMGRVSGSAKGIDSVIEGLDKIAFQTRVLAMNAAVEAGRAGDAGRGFAVVADLVSALAMRAEEEAKRARDQLTVTQSEIITAVDAVQKVDVAFADISGDVDAVHSLLASMAHDNQAQSVAITEITAAVANMDRATQQNAAMVEETSAAARSLTGEVETLADLAGTFRTDGTAANASQRRPAMAMRVPPAAIDTGAAVLWQ